MIVTTEFLGKAGYKATFEINGETVVIEHSGSYTALLDLIDAEMAKHGISNYGVNHVE